MATLPPVRLLLAPYDSGHFGVRMGAGPLALAGAGAAAALSRAGHAVEAVVLHPASEWHAELRTTFELHASIAEAVADASKAGAVPLVLSGNCSGSVGVLAALGRSGQRVGLLWLDAHGDYNTPEEDPMGFLDGQALATAVGRCWQSATARLKGFTPVPEQHVVLIGARDLTDPQRQALATSSIRWLPPGSARDVEILTSALDDLASRVDIVHVHVDLDVYDPSIAPANGYAARDGLTAEEVKRVVRLTADRLPIAAATLASYDPSYDWRGHLSNVALELLVHLGASR